MSKIHFAHIQIITEALKSIFKEGFYADKVIERTLKSNPKMGSSDRGFVAETTYDVVRWWRLLNYCTETEFDASTELNNDAADQSNLNNENHLLNVLSAYFFIFKNTKAQWQENYGIDFEKIEAKYNEAQLIPAVKHSVPDWMYEILMNENINADNELEALNHQADVIIRVNTLKTTKDKLSRELYHQQIATHESELSENALILDERRNIFRNELFLEGHFEVQDAGSQCIADFTNAEPGMRVVDACAGAGGKTLALAAKMKNKGRILSMDVEKIKLDELMRRARRAGAGIIEPRVIESSKTIKRLKDSADCLLLDVPCSGLGTMRRNPDLKWKLKESFLKEVKEKQKNILQQYAQMVKPGGKLIYATCSILPSENENQVAFFLKNNPGFKLEEEHAILPSQHNSDGFYMARMVRLVN
jgi:16S rRNA (cytosine967-C5)-methyltransferase